jgi:hypothetical protein
MAVVPGRCLPREGLLSVIAGLKASGGRKEKSLPLGSDRLEKVRKPETD